MSNDELHRLLYPIAPELFLASYWERVPIYIGGSRDKFSDLFSMAAFEHALADHESKGITLRVSYDSQETGSLTGVHAPIRVRDMLHHLKRGATICADPIQRGDSRLAGFAVAVKRQLNHAGLVSFKCYLSSPKCGFNMHFDRQIGTTLQIEGRKRWRFSRRPAVMFPTRNAVLDTRGTARYVGRRGADVRPWEEAEGPKTADLEEVVLEPGDVLCLPAGTWHEAKAIEQSLALNLSFAPLGFLDLLNLHLAQTVTEHTAWRANLPAHASRDDESGVPDAAWLRFVDARLAEFTHTAQSLRATDPKLVAAWARMVRGGPSGPLVTPAFLGLGEFAPGGQPRREPRNEHLVEGASSDYDGTVTVWLTVLDLEAAMSWYTGKVGFRVTRTAPAVRWCELEMEGVGARIGLSESAGPVKTGDVALALGVVNLREMRMRLEGLGVDFEGPTIEIPGMVMLAIFRDPDGNRLILSQEL